MTSPSSLSCSSSSPFNDLTDQSFPYSPPSIRCQPIIDYTSIQYHDYINKLPIDLFEDADYKFGIFNLHIRGEIPITKNHLHLFFTIDSTGSMQDICSDGRSKMEHILHTLENMLYVFHESTSCEISIHVQSFDTIIYEIISNVENINKADINLLVQKIKKIRPRGSTNIECALKSASNQIAQYKSLHPDHDVAHIFLTDGEITDGAFELSILQSVVPKDCTNIFIGYGKYHDAYLLTGLASGKQNQYCFIDALEKSGMVYGEVIHSLLYKAIADVNFQTEDCEIYDYATNTWTSNLEIGNLLSEQKKIYHLRSKSPEKSCIKVYGKTIVQTSQFEEIKQETVMQTECYYKSLTFPPLTAEDLERELKGNNLVNYVLRQRTQELLFEARKHSENKKSSRLIFPYRCFNEYETSDQELSADDTLTLKKKLKQFHTLLLNFIKENHLENDAFLKTLCDDIYIAHKTAGTQFASMFTAARQTTQGRQQAYNCTTIDDLDEPKLNPQGNLRRLNRNVQPDDDSNIDNYCVTNDALSPYSCFGVVNLMRGVSANDSIGVDHPNLVPDTQTQTLSLESP